MNKRGKAVIPAQDWPSCEKLGITSLSAIVPWFSCRTMMNALFLYASCSIMVMLFSVNPSVFSWTMLGRGSSSAPLLLPRPDKGVFWPSPIWTHPAGAAVVALATTDLESISGNAATWRATWRHLLSSFNTWQIWKPKEPLKGKLSNRFVFLKMDACTRHHVSITLPIMSGT